MWIESVFYKPVNYFKLIPYIYTPIYTSTKNIIIENISMMHSYVQ